MAITVKHTKVSTIPDGDDTSLIRPSDWNADHQLVGTVPPANGGTGATTLTGYVKGNGTSTMTASSTIPNTDVTGLGTMSTQNANAIAVTGGTMSGVNISDYVATATKGVANGVASLDGSGTVPISQLPSAVIGALSYQGTWNASTNTPTLTSSVGTKGYYYVVNIAGSTNLNGITDWQVGDWAVYNGSAWQKIDNTDAVTSVNGYTGTVVLTQTDISGTVPTSRTITAGTGLTGGGDLSANRTLAIATTGVSAATYGSASVVPVIAVNTQGQITSATNTSIAIANTQVSGLGTMSTQNANSVAVTGGTINGTSIGATTPSTGAFSYVSTNSVTNTTPSLSFNGSNTNLASGAIVSGSYLQNILQNKSGTASASTNYVLSNDLGTDSTYYGEFGMNSSVFSSGTPADFFSINNGVYFSAHDGDVSIGSGNGYKTYFAWGTTGNHAHVINASGAIGLDTSITGATNFGTAGQVLTSGGSGATPTWTTPTTGTVTSVGATSPVVSSGGNTPTISMPAATTSVNGYLTSTDWTTFNNKQAALVSGTNIKTVNGTSLLGSGDVPVGVLTVTGTAPVVSSGGANPAISMAAANTTTNGYLTSTDWNTFNNKSNTNGTVTSVAALTLGTTGTDLSSTVANGTTTPVITLQVPTASATNRGALSSTDWSTFNNKAPGVTFTTSYVPYGQGTTTLNQSSSFTFASSTLTAPIVSASNGFHVNSNTVSASYSIPSGSSASSVGPITVATGQTVTIPSGSRWVVL